MARTFRMVDGDIFFDVNGRLEYISGFDKVSQDIAEVLLTELDLDRDYGSELPLVASDPSYNLSQQQVSSFVGDAVDRLRKLQRTNTTTTKSEEIASIDSIEVYQNDQTEILFGLAVSTSDRNAVQSTIRMVPRPVSLNHLLPPSTTQQNQETTAKLLGRNALVTGGSGSGE